MASTAPSMLKAAAPLARAAVSAAQRASLRGTVGAAQSASLRAAAVAAKSSPVRAAANAVLNRLDPVTPRGHRDRHPLTPAAVRVERARSNRPGERADQTAITVWFGEGPSLPVPGGSNAMRSAVRLGTGLLGAVALAALTAIAARREESRTRVVEAPSPAVPIP